jgi:glycosyltransferase involved in cell wall biosynthesis/Flp pilus assembly protein TadD
MFSIIVPCFNQLALTRLCLESVLRQTAPAYELVLVDNGSTDGTAEYFASVSGWAGSAKIHVVRNAENRGFPAAVNQGLAAARGEFVVLLNNDVVVTPGWLDRLASWADGDGSRVGLVGPVTNYAPAPQLTLPTYQSDLGGLDEYARRRAEVFAGQALETQRLTGFCLLIRHEVLDEIGGRLDEGFGLGFFDDDDLCLRARKAGYKLLVALDAYVHHFGSRTFRALGVDTTKLLQENLEKFRQKWGDAETRGYRLPTAGPSAAAAPQGRPRVSLTMIVRDEERHLPECLKSVADLVDEVVVVDTGSSDRTRDIARSFGAKVYDFPWVDSFSAARNEALRHATGDWVFWMDADDRLDEKNRGMLRGLFAQLGRANAAYALKCFCPEAGSDAATVVDHVRLFRNRPEVRWRYRVHEQILPSVRESGAAVGATDITITHVGYQDPAARQKKLARDLRLLELEYAEQPDDPFTLFNLGQTCRALGRVQEALAHLERSLARSSTRDSIVRKLYCLVAACQNQLGRPEEAIQACAAGREQYPDDAELLYFEAGLHFDRGDYATAEGLLRRLLEGGEGPHFASVSEGLRGYRARHCLGDVYRGAGRLAEAEAEWRRSLDEKPDYLPSHVALADLLLSQSRWDEAEAEALRLHGLPGDGPAIAAAVQGRVLMGRGQNHAAWRLLAEAASRYPKSQRLRVLGSHAALRAGLEHEAERALLAILEHDSEDAEARANLDALRTNRDLRRQTVRGGG